MSKILVSWWRIKIQWPSQSFPSPVLVSKINSRALRAGSPALQLAADSVHSCFGKPTNGVDSNQGLSTFAIFISPSNKTESGMLLQRKSQKLGHQNQLSSLRMLISFNCEDYSTILALLHVSKWEVHLTHSVDLVQETTTQLALLVFVNVTKHLSSLNAHQSVWL